MCLNTHSNFNFENSELQKSNGRVNALEHVVIPLAKESIKYITVKIEELELSTVIKLLD